MDESEKMLLRRRKQFVAESVDLTDDLIKDLRNAGLLTDDVIAQLHLEKSNQTKIQRLVEHLINSKNADTFRQLCDTLAPCYRWLVRDLKADLRVERGEVKPEHEAIQEAAALVHSRFGTSKRFSETDKKDMAEMIAVRLQIAEDEWKAEIDKLTEQFAETRRRLEARDRVAKIIDSEQKSFVRRHEKQLVSHAHDMTTTRDFIRQMLADDQDATNGGAEMPEGQQPPTEIDINPLVAIKGNSLKLLKQMSFALNQRESLFYEKEKCLKLLGISDPKAALDEAVSRATGLNLVTADQTVEDKTETIRKLRKQVQELEDELEKVVGGVDDLRRQLDDRDREISKLRHMVHID